MIKLVSKDKSNFILLIGLIICLFVFRTAIPSLKYPFIVLYAYMIVQSTINSRKIVLRDFWPFVKIYIKVIVLFLVFVIASVLSNKIYLVSFKEIANILIILSFFYVLELTIKTKKQLNRFTDSLIYLFLGFAFVISVIHLFKIKQINVNQAIDYNFALIPIFFGLLVILTRPAKKETLWEKMFYLIFILTFSLAIMISGSRRGLIAFSLIIVILCIVQILLLFKKTIILKNLGTHSRLFLVLLLTSVLSLYFVTFHTSYKFKFKLIETFSDKKIKTIQQNITVEFLRYLGIVNQDLTYENLYKKIWKQNFDPKDPDSGWGTRIHKSVFPLSGKGVENIPKDVIGYYMDKSSNASFRHGNSYSYTSIGSDSVAPGDSLEASVYCYVSEDFDGSWAELRCEYYRDSLAKVNHSDRYNLNQKGSWQHLSITKKLDSHGFLAVYLYWAKRNSVNFDSLKGSVIFAYPQFSILKAPNNDSTKEELPKEFTELKNYNRRKNYYENNLSGNIADIARTLPNEPQDYIRELARRVINEDTTYDPLKSNIKADTIYNHFIQTRTVRWQFALKIFKHEYNLRQKLLGNGFAFLNWFGYQFYNDKLRSDWPHNPFLSVLLYSGIVGVILFLLLLYEVIRTYIKYINEYPLFFLFFCTTFFFSFFSAGDPFDPPIMGFLMILPFFIDHIHKKHQEIRK